MSVLTCICGYSCGTRKALDKHFNKFAGSDGHGPTEQTLQIIELSEQFHYYDTSGDRQLDFEELSALLRKGCPHIDDGKIRMLFETADSDGTGLVDFDEFLTLVFANPEEHEAALVKSIGSNPDISIDVWSFSGHQKSAPSPTSNGCSPPASRQRRSFQSSPPASPARRGPSSDGTSPTIAREKAVPHVDSVSTTAGSADMLTVERVRPRLPTFEDSFSSGSTFTPISSPATVQAQSDRSPQQIAPYSPTQYPPSSGSTFSGLESKVRLLIIRHGKSANRGRKKGEAASLDPELSEVGYEQAEALGKRLEKDLKRINPGDIMVASSPMKRCLLTIRPAVFRLKVAPGDCIVHGGCFEYGCAGAGNTGTPVSTIVEDFPEFTPVGFKGDGTWDYRGSNNREDEVDAKARAARIVDWLWDTAQTLSLRPSRRAKVLILSLHQTLADLLTQIIVDGTDSEWVYGDMKYKLQNTGITEITLDGYHEAKLTTENDSSHLRTVSQPKMKDKEKSGKLKAELRAQFRAMDTSGDFRLDFNEMSELLRRGNPGLTDDELWSIFRGVDTTNDGDVDFDEFVEFVFGTGA